MARAGTWTARAWIGGRGWTYSHGTRFVRRKMTVNGTATTIDAVLADPKLCALLSDEGPLRDYRYGAVSGVSGNALFGTANW